MAGMHPKLKVERVRRQHRRATHRYRLRNPTHKQKTGHRFKGTQHMRRYIRYARFAEGIDESN